MSCTAQKMKFFITPSRTSIWSHLLKKSLMENFILHAVSLKCNLFQYHRNPAKFWREENFADFADLGKIREITSP